MKRLVGFPIVLIVLLWCSTSHAELRGYWSFDDGAGTTLTDNSGRGNDGQLMGAVSQPQWASGHTGQAGDSSLRFLPTTGNRDNDPYVLLGDPDDLDIEGDQTISMWLMPTNLSWNGGRQNPYAKAYGGSGTITQESSGSPNYYYGDSGSTGGWEGFSATTPSVVDQWNHITIVRDLTNGERHWYVNGKENWNTTTKSAKAGTRPAYFARGYVSNYHGYIGDLCRMGIIGEPDAELVELLGFVETVQQAARLPIRAGARGGDIADIAVPMVKGSAHSAYTHFIVHGMGLVSHEAPRLMSEPRFSYAGDDAEYPLDAGMCLSVETTMRHPKRGFIKLEDTVLVTADGWEGLGDGARGWNRAGTG